jgi:hypothetical protein
MIFLALTTAVAIGKLPLAQRSAALIFQELAASTATENSALSPARNPPNALLLVTPSNLSKYALAARDLKAF